MKDLKRHEVQVHNKPGRGELRAGWYACWCFYPTSRKDDMKRHLRTCKRKPLLDSYVCRCLRQIVNRDELISTLQHAAQNQEAGQNSLRFSLPQMLSKAIKPSPTPCNFTDDQMSRFTVHALTSSLMVTYRFLRDFPTCSQPAPGAFSCCEANAERKREMYLFSR